MKIAIISSNQYNMIGGTETYARNLIKVLADKHEITEFPVQVSNVSVAPLDERIVIDNRLLGWKPTEMVWGGTYTKKNMEYIYSNFDVVVLNNTLPPKKWVSHPKSVLIQHQSVGWYKFFGKPFWLAVGGFFSWAFFGVSGTLGNPFTKASHPVFFDQTTSCATENKPYFIPLPSEVQDGLNLERKGFIYFGRLEQKQKNIYEVAKIANQVKELSIFGSGPQKKSFLRKLKDKNQYKGFLNKDDLAKTLQSKKGMILVSNWEGFPFTVVEALHAGTPVVLYNTFDSAKYFEKSGAVFIVKNKQELISKLEWLDNLSNKDLNTISSKARAFARKELVIENFEKGWEQILRNFHKEKK